MVKLKRRCNVVAYSKACVLCRVGVTFSLNIQLIRDVITSPWSPRSRLLGALGHLLSLHDVLSEMMISDLM